MIRISPRLAPIALALCEQVVARPAWVLAKARAVRQTRAQRAAVDAGEIRRGLRVECESAGVGDDADGGAVVDVGDQVVGCALGVGG